MTAWSDGESTSVSLARTPGAGTVMVAPAVTR
jgi:hypothetical protein